MPEQRRNGLVRFSEEEKALLRRYLRSYRNLVAGRIPANTAARKRFVEVAEGRRRSEAIHEIAFVKWQMWMRLRPYEVLDENIVDVASEPIGRSKRISGAPAMAEPFFSTRIRDVVGRLVDRSSTRGRDALEHSASWFNSALGTEFALQLDRWMRDTFAAGKATIYDKAMDAAHIASPSGPFHRLWDGGHSLIDAWTAVKNASPDDTFAQEVAGYLGAIWKDVVTPMGLPIATVDREWFQQTAVTLKEFGITKHQFADAISQTGSELAGAALGVVALLLNWDKADAEKAASLAGSLGVSTICAANPILGLVAVACFARAYQTAKNANSKSSLPVGLFSGSAGSAVILASSSIIAGPVWVGLLVGIVASILTQRAISSGAKRVGEVDWNGVREWVVSAVRTRAGLTGLLSLKTA